MRRRDPLDDVPGCFFLAGGLAFLVWLVFWASVIFVAIHFIGKYW